MRFVDKTIVALADPTTRAGLFPSDALEAILGVAYDTQGLGLQGPFTAVFDDVRLSFPVTARATIEGGWTAPGQAQRTEALLRIAGIAAQEAPRIDALWRGAVVARSASAVDRVASVSGQFIGQGTPADRAQGHFEVGFGPPGAVSVSVRPFPISVAVLVRDADFSVSTLLGESKLVRARLEDSGMEAPSDASLRRREAIVVAWIVPSTSFDDADWPGGGGGGAPAQRVGRIRAARGWLGREGVALVPRDAT